jgi:hypothetical protein
MYLELKFFGGPQPPLALCMFRPCTESLFFQERVNSTESFTFMDAIEEISG